MSHGVRYIGMDVHKDAPTDDARLFDAEREREAQMPCSAESLKTATEAQRKNCLNQNSINRAMDALSAHPSSRKKLPANSGAHQ